jgi:hypothetical protein
LKLAFTTAWRASQRWQGVRMIELGHLPDGTQDATELNLQQLAA